MSKITFKGYWPDCDPSAYAPWAKWSLRLWDEEAGDWVEDREDILKVLEMSGIRSLDELLRGETKSV